MSTKFADRDNTDTPSDIMLPTSSTPHADTESSRVPQWSAAVDDDDVHTYLLGIKDGKEEYIDFRGHLDNYFGLGDLREQHGFPRKVCRKKKRSHAKPRKTSSSQLDTPVDEIPWSCRATQTTIRWDLAPPGQPLSMDIEFQRYRKAGEATWSHRHGRVALVNMFGETVVDVYPAYEDEEGVEKDCYSRRFSVEPPDFLLKNGAVPAREFEAELKALMKDRPIIVHDATGDSKAFYYPENQDAFTAANGVQLHDTQEMYSHLQENGRPGLTRTYKFMTGNKIQASGIHNPVEDAKATAELFQMASQRGEVQIAGEGRETVRECSWSTRSNEAAESGEGAVALESKGFGGIDFSIPGRDAGSIEDAAVSEDEEVSTAEEAMSDLNVFDDEIDEPGNVAESEVDQKREDTFPP